MYSVVVITFNEADQIGNCLKSVQKISDDLIVVDSGSTDNTVQVATSCGARVIQTEWKGYGPTKNFGCDQAKYDWIICLDADESFDEQLQSEIQKLSPKEDELYLVQFHNFYCGQRLRFTEWKPMHKIRIFNKMVCRWNDKEVHEALEPIDHLTQVKLKGKCLHYSYVDEKEHKEKTEKYAILSAKRWIQEDVNPGLLKRIFGPSLRFVKSYILNLGFLEGKIGFRIASINAYSVRRKIQLFDEYKKEDNGK